MRRAGLWLWCFPQMLFGWLLKLFTRAWELPGRDCYLYTVTLGSISLGEYVFLAPQHWGNETVRRHELGHREQSRRLGWLYLFVIGIPSIIWAGCFGWYRKKHNKSYYDFYTERWADKLGGVVRKE